jgi:Spy/CpxP family protein refolding chaperone
MEKMMIEPTQSNDGRETPASPPASAPYSLTRFRSLVRKPNLWILAGVLLAGGVCGVAFAENGDRHDQHWYARYSDDTDDTDGHRGYSRYGDDTDGHRHDQHWYARYSDDTDDTDGHRGGHHWYSRYGDDTDGPHGAPEREEARPLLAGPVLGSRFVQDALAQVNASDDQRAKVRDLMRAARNDIEVMRDHMPDLRTVAIDELGKPTIDRAALETLRADRQKVADEISKRMTQEAADVAEVFTPEQRATLAAELRPSLLSCSR